MDINSLEWKKKIEDLEEQLQKKYGENRRKNSFISSKYDKGFKDYRR